MWPTISQLPVYFHNQQATSVSTIHLQKYIWNSHDAKNIANNYTLQTINFLILKKCYITQLSYYHPSRQYCVLKKANIFYSHNLSPSTTIILKLPCWYVRKQHCNSKKKVAAITNIETRCHKMHKTISRKEKNIQQIAGTAFIMAASILTLSHNRSTLDKVCTSLWIKN